MAKPEDRNIYLTKESASSLYHEGGHYSARLFDAPGLFLVNRECYAETLPLQKRKVTLIIVNANLSETYVKRMGYIKRNLVTNFIFYGPTPNGIVYRMNMLDWDFELHQYYKTISLKVEFDAEGPGELVEVGKANVTGAIEDSNIGITIDPVEALRSRLRDRQLLYANMLY